MTASMNREGSATSQLSDAMAKSLRPCVLQTPVVYEQNDCVVVEMPAPGVRCDELELRLEDQVALSVSEPSGACSATIVLPAPISLADSVIYCVGGALSMTFVKAEAVEALEGTEVGYELPAMGSRAS